MNKEEHTRCFLFKGTVGVAEIRFIFYYFFVRGGTIDCLVIFSYFFFAFFVRGTPGFYR